jgi:hypothetical protein
MIITMETSACLDYVTPSGFNNRVYPISIIMTPLRGFEGETIYQQHLNDLDELKKSVLQKAFNGELNTEKSRRDAMIIAMQNVGNPNPEGVK